VPESLGNTTAILPPGTVCDDCNNYFSRKVEKPFLEDKEIVLLRTEESIYSKRKKTPMIKVLFNGEITGQLHRQIVNGHEMTLIELEPENVQEFFKMKESHMFVKGFSIDHLPEGIIVSRFLAKMALEFLAYRIMNDPEWQQEIIENEGFEPLRQHARYGKIKNWPYNVRRIYDTHEKWSHLDEDQQMMWESDLFFTGTGELYFVIAIFGIEFSINVAGPSIEGYEKWLDENNNESPLYCGKNKIIDNAQNVN